MESLDQPIFYGNRSSPLSTAHTSRLIWCPWLHSGNSSTVFV
jgi:hypothetical protein